MRKIYANEFIQNTVLVVTTTCVYQLIFHENDCNETKILQYFIMYELGLYIKLKCFVAHMFYAWTLSHNTSVPIYIKYNKYWI